MNPTIQHLIDKLIILNKTYQKAEKKVYNDLLAYQMKTLKTQKQKFLDEIDHEMTTDANEYHYSVRNQILTDLEKSVIQLDGRLMEDEDEKLISFCIELENDLFKYYNQLTNQYNQTAFEHALFASQRNDVKRTVAELNEIIHYY